MSSSLITHNLKAQKRLRDFEPEVSLCPLCSRRFKQCRHDVSEVLTFLRGDIWAIGDKRVLF